MSFRSTLYLHSLTFLIQGHLRTSTHARLPKAPSQQLKTVACLLLGPELIPLMLNFLLRDLEQKFKHIEILIDIKI